MVELIVYGILAHLFADFFLQSAWMNDNKMWLSRSFGGWLHGLIHFVAVLFILGWHGAVIVSCLHIAIDTRVPLMIWRKFYRQSQTSVGNPGFIAFAMWQDQVAHFLVIAGVSWLITTLS